LLASQIKTVPELLSLVAMNALAVLFSNAELRLAGR
jgi:hypothetical protein